MLGDFFTRILVLLLGYAYPAFECYKAVEKNKPEIQELRYWCKYWILVALLTVFERVGDIFVSWLPMYGEMKVAFLIYLWHPKTKGTSYVYEMLMRPYMARHELDIDQNIRTLRTRGLEIFVQLWQCSFRWIQTTIVQFFPYLQEQSAINQKNGQPKLKPRNQTGTDFSFLRLLSQKEPSKARKSQLPSPEPQSPVRNGSNVSSAGSQRTELRTKQELHTPRMKLFLTRIGYSRPQSPTLPRGSAAESLGSRGSQ